MFVIVCGCVLYVDYVIFVWNGNFILNVVMDINCCVIIYDII